MSKEKRVVFFEGKSWYHRTKELQDDLTTKYGKKGGFETPEEAEKSYWEYEKRYQKKQRNLQIPLFKISGLLGHSSVHTTYEYYCEIMDEQDKIIAFVNNTFVPQRTGTEG